MLDVVADEVRVVGPHRRGGGQEPAVTDPALHDLGQVEGVVAEVDRTVQRIVFTLAGRVVDLVLAVAEGVARHRPEELLVDLVRSLERPLDPLHERVAQPHPLLRVSLSGADRGELRRPGDVGDAAVAADLELVGPSVGVDGLDIPLQRRHAALRGVDGPLEGGRLLARASTCD